MSCSMETDANFKMILSITIKQTKLIYRTGSTFPVIARIVLLLFIMLLSLEIIL